MSNGNELGHVPYADLESTEAWDHVVAAVADVLVTLDGNRNIKAIVDEQPATLGYTTDELVGTSLPSLVSQETPPSPLFDTHSPEQLQRALFDDETDTVVAPLETADGTTVPITLTSISPPDTDDLVIVGQEVSDPVTGVGEHHSEMHLLDNIGDPVYVLDADGYIEYVNDALVEYTGYEPAELRGREMAELIPSTADVPGNPEKMEFDAAASHPSRTVETTIITNDGERILTEANVTVLTDDGSYAGTLGVLRDIRERKQREQNLDLLKQVLTRVFRHNIRNELVVAKGHTDLLEEQIDDDLRQHTETIRETTNRLLSHSEKARLIEQVIDTDERYDIDLTSNVSDVVSTVRDEYPEATIDVDVPSNVAVEAHPEISIAIEELLENAIEHAPPEATPRIEIWIEQREGITTLFVEDESGGLADHELTVLERGAESDLEHGSGVGLWLIRWLVEYSDADMIAHRTDDGSLMGIRFGQQGADAKAMDDTNNSPLTRTPAHVRDVSPESFRGDTVIGRVDALGKLEDIYDSLKQTGGQSVLLTGEAGIGKTTLVEQFRHGLADRADDSLVATGFCSSDVQSSYHAFRQVMTDLPTDRDMSEILADAAPLEIDDAEEFEQRKRAVFADIADELRVVAEEQPVVLLIEDMHWADQGTIDLFEYLVETVGRWGHPIMFLGTYRTSDVEQSHPVLEIAEQTADAGRGTVIELAPFGSDDVRSLITHMLDLEQLPVSFVEAVHDHTGGTPLFVNELTRHLADTVGPIENGRDLPKDLEDVPVPETVEGAITDRLDALPQAIHPVLRLGAVIGTEFSFDLLREASDQSVDTLVECTNILTRRQVWERSPDGLQFVHGIIREQTLEAIPAEERTQLHAQLADAIETVYEDSLDEYAGRLALHYNEISEYDTAVAYYRQAGNYEADRYAQEDAIEYYEQALSIAEEHDIAIESGLAGIHTDLGETFELIGEYDQARQQFERSIDKAHQTDDLELQAESLNNLGEVSRRLDEYDQAIGYYEEALRKSRQYSDEEQEAESLLGFGTVYFSRGQFDRANEYLEEALSITEKLDDRQLQAGNLNRLGIVATKQGRYDQAQQYYERTLAISDDLGEQRLKAKSLNNLGNINKDRGAYKQAKEYYERSLTIKQEIGDRYQEAATLYNLANLAKSRGDLGQAHEYLNSSLAIAEEVGDRRGKADYLSSLGGVIMNQGNPNQAEEYYERSLSIYEEIDDRHGRAISIGKLGDIARLQGEYEVAREYYDQSRTLLDGVGARPTKSIVLILEATVARNQGELDEAKKYAERGLEISENIGFKEGEYLALRVLGGVTRERWDLEEAQRHLTESVEIARDLGSIEKLEVFRELGALARQQDDYQQAIEHFEQALDVCSEDEFPHERGKTHLERSRLALARGDSESARDAVDTAWNIFTDLNATHWEARAQLLQGRLVAEAGSLDNARGYWREALDTFEEVGAQQDTLETLRHLVETCRKQGENEQATEYQKRAKTVFENAPDPVQAIHGEWIDL